MHPTHQIAYCQNTIKHLWKVSIKRQTSRTNKLTHLIWTSLYEQIKLTSYIFLCCLQMYSICARTYAYSSTSSSIESKRTIFLYTVNQRNNANNNTLNFFFVIYVAAHMHTTNKSHQSSKNTVCICDTISIVYVQVKYIILKIKRYLRCMH